MTERVRGFAGSDEVQEAPGKAGRTAQAFLLEGTLDGDLWRSPGEEAAGLFYRIAPDPQLGGSSKEAISAVKPPRHEGRHKPRNRRSDWRGTPIPLEQGNLRLKDTAGQCQNDRPFGDYRNYISPVYGAGGEEPDLLEIRRNRRSAKKRERQNRSGERGDRICSG